MNHIRLKDNTSEHFDLIQYPDGQKSITLKLPMLNVKHTVEITCRIKNFSELEVLCCLIAALKANDFQVSRIRFVYLFGIRSDRAFEKGQPNYFRDVLTPIIKLFKAKKIKICWPFMPLALECSSFETARWKRDTFLIKPQFSHIDFLAIAGDESACGYLHQLRCIKPKTGMILDPFCSYFNKTRSPRGKIKISLSATLGICIAQAKNILIIDDLCDGGATFIEEAKIIKKINPEAKLILHVYHGLFTNGLDKLLKYYEEIHCSDSYQLITHPRVKQWSVF